MEDQLTLPDLIVGIVMLAIIIAVIYGLIKEKLEPKVSARDHNEKYYCYGCRRKHTDNEGCD